MMKLEEIKTSVHHLYEKYKTKRSPYIERAKLVCAVTIPSLSPEELRRDGGEMHTTSQGVGSHGTNNLASRLMLALMPANMPFFRIHMDEKLKEEAEAESSEGTNLTTEIERVLSKRERKIQEDIESTGDRAKMYQALKLVLCTGNVLLDTYENKMRVIPLSNFVVRRDPSGNLLETIVVEEIDVKILKTEQPEVYEALTLDREFTDLLKRDEPIKLYTRNFIEDENWVTYQEVGGIELPNERGVYPLDAPRYIVLAPYRLDGEDYARPYIEEFVGDLINLEFFNIKLKDGAEAAAKFLIFVNPNGTVMMQDVSEAENGDVLMGDAADISTFQAQKFSDYQVVKSVMDAIEARLNRAFLLNSAIQRAGERVTAEEIRYMAQELENSLGGLYSVLSEDFQKKYINRKIHYMTRHNKLPKLPDGTTKLSIVTGIEAIGRGNDRTKLVSFIETLHRYGGPQAVSRVNLTEFAKRLAASDGIDIENLIVTDEEIQAQQQEQGMMDMANNIAPEAVRQLGNVMQNQPPPEEGEVNV